MIRIYLIDDQALIRQGLCSLLNFAEGIEVVHTDADGAAAIARLQDASFQAQIDLLLLDIRMPKATGIEVLQTMQRQNIDIPAILLTTFDDHELILQGVQAGARGYLLKDISLDKLVESIHTVMAGGRAIQPALTERLLDNLAGKNVDHQDAEQEKLSGKEIEVLKLMASGFSNKEIAASLHNAEGTIKNHISSLIAKLQVRDRTQAVVKAIELSLLD